MDMGPSTYLALGCAPLREVVTPSLIMKTNRGGSGACRSSEPVVRLVGLAAKVLVT